MTAGTLFAEAGMSRCSTTRYHIMRSMVVWMSAPCNKPNPAASKRSSQPTCRPCCRLLPADGPLDLPFTPPLPQNYFQFAALVKGRSAEDLKTLIHRIRSYNAVALATDNKHKMQVGDAQQLCVPRRHFFKFSIISAVTCI